MKLSPFGHFLFGSALGASIAALVLVHVFTSRIETQSAHLRESWQRIEEQHVQQLQSLAAERDTARAETAACQQQARQLDSAAHVYDGWYTLLYEPGAPAAAPPLELLNLLRPGLGTLLARLQPPSQSDLQLRYVLPGIVTPVHMPPGSHAVRTRISPGSEAQ